MAGGVHVINSYRELARVGLEKVVLLAERDMPKQWSMLVRKATTRQRYAEMASIGDFGYAQITDEDQVIQFDRLHKGFIKRFTPVMYANGFAITEQAQFTDIYNQLKNVGPKLAMSMLHTKNQAVANIFNNGFSTSFLGPDGSPLFGNDDNTPNTGHAHAPGVPRGKNRPDTDLTLSPLAVEQGLQELRKTKSHRGLPAPVMGQLYLLTGPDQWAKADRIVGSNQQQGTADHDMNWVKNKVEVMVNDYLTSSTAWFLLPRNIENTEIYLVSRIPMFTKEDYITERLRHIFVVGEEYATGWVDYRGVWGTTGA